MPARLRNFAKAAKYFGWTLEENGKKHQYRLTKPDERMYPVPAHNGDKTEISDVYLKAFCRQYGIDWDEFKSKL